jgi:hypothetical protein
MISRAWSHGTFFQTQGDVARNGVVRHHVETGKVRDQLKHGPDLDVLEVKRELLAGVTELFLFEGLLLLLGEWLDIDRQDLIGLIGELLVVPTRGDDHAGAAEVQRDARGVVDGEGLGRLARRSGKPESHPAPRCLVRW